MPRSESWFTIVFLLVLAAITLWLAQATKIKLPAPAAAVRHEPDAIVDNFTAKQYDPSGAVRSVLRAGKMLHYPDDDSSRLLDVHYEGQQPEQAPFSVRAKESTVSSDRKDVFFYGDVRAQQASSTGQPPLVVTTQKLHVRPDEGIARTDQAVLIEQGASRATGSSLEVDNNTRIAKLTNVRATYHLAPRQR
jgi:lipopolysaccharide export system protein LptC